MFFEDAKVLAEYILENSVRYEDHSNEGEASCQGFVCRICRHMVSAPETRPVHAACCEYLVAERLLSNIRDYDAIRSSLLKILESPN